MYRVAYCKKTFDLAQKVQENWKNQPENLESLGKSLLRKSGNPDKENNYLKFYKFAKNKEYMVCTESSRRKVIETTKKKIRKYLFLYLSFIQVALFCNYSFLDENTGLATKENGKSP